MLEQLLLIIQVIVCVFLVLLVLVQQGKGATMGAAFGSGASSTVFGSKGSGSFLMKLTGLIAFIFFANSLALCYVSAEQAKTAVRDTIIQMPVPAPVLMEPTRQVVPVMLAKKTLPVSEPKTSAPEKPAVHQSK